MVDFLKQAIQSKSGEALPETFTVTYVVNPRTFKVKVELIDDSIESFIATVNSNVASFSRLKVPEQMTFLQIETATKYQNSFKIIKNLHFIHSKTSQDNYWVFFKIFFVKLFIIPEIKNPKVSLLTKNFCNLELQSISPSIPFSLFSFCF